MKTPAAFLILVGIFGTQEPASMGTAELEARVKERGRALSSILASDSVRPEEFKEAARALFEDDHPDDSRKRCHQNECGQNELGGEHGLDREAELTGQAHITMVAPPKEAPGQVVRVRFIW